MKLLDTNGDGQINFDEFLVAVRVSYDLNLKYEETLEELSYIKHLV